MFTDDEIRDAFHTAFSHVVRDAVADPAMLSAVRQRRARQRRLLTVGAPLGVAVVTVGAVVGVAAAIHPAGRDKVTPASQGDASQGRQHVSSLQSVSLVGHSLSLPSDWTLSGNRSLINLNTVEPAQPVGGKDQSVIATSPDGTQRFDATVYTGPIAAAERSGDSAGNDPTFSHFSINGREASTKISAAPTKCITGTPPSQHAGSPRVTTHARATGGAFETGACPKADSAEAPYGEARYTFGNGDFMLVDTDGMDSDALANFLTTALSN